MREYVEPIYGWDDDVQLRYHGEWFDPSRLSIIEDDEGTALGVVEVSDEGDYLYLSRIEILPPFQDRGLGTAVVRDLLRRGREVRLHIFPNNARARRLYERLGFTVDRHAEEEHRLSMYHPGEALEDG